MKKNFKHSCLTENVFKNYYIEYNDSEAYILPDETSDTQEVCPMDNAAATVLEYLAIGYSAENGIDTADAVLAFVSKYGLPKRKSKRLKAFDFAEEARMLYLHFREISSEPYPDEPEWILETEPASAVIKKSNGESFIEWQTKNLASAIEVAYTLLMCGTERYIGCCKHCGMPFLIKNPKTEFCSPACRNKFNVYKSRGKQLQSVN